MNDSVAASPPTRIEKFEASVMNVNNEGGSKGDIEIKTANAFVVVFLVDVVAGASSPSPRCGSDLR